MLNEERQRAILDLLRRDGRVLVVDLAKHFHTSQVTIRKDLETLHLKGSIHRTHGGGLPAGDGATARTCAVPLRQAALVGAYALSQEGRARKF